jgi:hypothetical protein
MDHWLCADPRSRPALIREAFARLRAGLPVP